MPGMLMRSALIVSVVTVAAACTPATVGPETPARAPAVSSSPSPGVVLADAVAVPAPATASDSTVQAAGGEPASRLGNRRALRTLGWISLGVSAESLLVAI